MMNPTNTSPLKMMSVTLTTTILLMMTMMMISGTDAGDDDLGKEEGRYIFINAEAPFTIAALINMPLSLALPTLRSQRHAEGYEYAYGYGGRSMIPGDSEVNDVFEDNDLLYDDPHYSEETSKIKTYFTYIQVEDESCREKLLCDLARDSEEYYPVSDIFLRQLLPRHGPIQEDENNRFWRYITASKLGVVSAPGDCRKQYPKCPLKVKDVLNMDILRVWQAVGRILNINFTDY